MVEFKSQKGEWIFQDLYIDSGADVTLLPYSVGGLLGFKLDPQEKVEEIGGIAGKLSVAKRKTTVRIDNFEFEVEIAWALTENVLLLLGRLDVFDVFHITFKQNEGVIIFQKP